MSFTVHTIKNGHDLMLKFKVGSTNSTERVLEMLRLGYLVEGGFLVNKQKEIIFEIERNGEYYFENFRLISSHTHFLNSFSNDEKEKKNGKNSDDENKRKRSVKDPNAPRRPLTAYILYFSEIQHEVKLSNPTLNQKDIVGMIGNQWKSIAEDDKLKYKEKAKELNEIYKKEMEKYLKENPNTEFAKNKKLLSEKLERKLKNANGKRMNEVSEVSDEDEEMKVIFETSDKQIEKKLKRN